MKQRDLIALMAASIYAVKLHSDSRYTRSIESMQYKVIIMAEAVREATKLNSLITDEEPPADVNRDI